MSNAITYRIAFDGVAGLEMDKQSGLNWSMAAEQAMQRGAVATLESRSQFPIDILEGITDSKGWIRLANKGIAVSPWQTIAEVNGREKSRVVVVGG